MSDTNKDPFLTRHFGVVDHSLRCGLQMYRHLSISVLAVILLFGCNPTDRLVSEIHKIQKESKENDRSVKVFAILEDKPPILALSAIDNPENAYKATIRNITVVITPTKVTLKYKELENSYPLYTNAFYGNEFYWLCHHLTGAGYIDSEYLIVCDRLMNPIATYKLSEFARYYPTTYMRLYPKAAFDKYAQYTQDEYEQWNKKKLKPSPN